MNSLSYIPYTDSETTLVPGSNATGFSNSDSGLARERKSRCSIITGALVLSIVCNILVLSAQFCIIGRQEPPLPTYGGNDGLRTLPLDVRPVNMVFRGDHQHYALSGGNASAEWDSIVPEGSGIAFLGDASESAPFVVSMWHQIRCLNHIRTALVNEVDTGFNYEYTHHCFQYLRQSILCAADTTIEPLDEAAGRPKSNATHTCRDWQQVHGWMSDRQSEWTAKTRERVAGSMRTHS
ncbi:hypothetical protein HGRIS_002052 [Hohenbuehelia grisea]|uniref:Uncharacterized protein n=1 Tax=Hohenbuehelia grisea TaxID=104357 RepID=A0ABR3JJA3_9AGAR